MRRLILGLVTILTIACVSFIPACDTPKPITTATQAQIYAAKATVDDLSAKVTAAQNDIVALKAKPSVSQAQLDQINNNFTALTNQYNTLAAQFATHVASSSTTATSTVTYAPKTQVDALGGQLDTLSADLTALKANVTALQNKINELVTANASQDARMASLESRVYALEHPTTTTTTTTPMLEAKDAIELVFDPMVNYMANDLNTLEEVGGKYITISYTNNTAQTFKDVMLRVQIFGNMPENSTNYPKVITVFPFGSMASWMYFGGITGNYSFQTWIDEIKPNTSGTIVAELVVKLKVVFANAVTMNVRASVA